MSRRVWDEIDALLKRILQLERRATWEGGGMPTAAHSVLHTDGETDEIDITTIGGFTGDPSDVLRGDGTWGPALGSSGAGQWIPTALGDGHMLLNAEGHSVLVWWEGP